MVKKINFTDKIFLAGSSGMVGNAVKKSLEKNGYGLKINNGKLLYPSKKELNLLEETSVNNWFKENKPEIVILAAAKVGGIYANSRFPADFLLENLKIQTNVIENSWKANVKRFLFLGSSCIYPKLAPQPLKEEYLLTGPLEKTNEPYAIAKIAGIKLCSALRRQYGFNAISVMPTNLYGPGDNYHEKDSHVMPALIRRIHHAKTTNKSEITCWGTGQPKREFLFVDDLAEACIFILENFSSTNQSTNDKNKIFDELINIGTGSDISIKKLSEIIALELNYKGDIKWDSTKPDGTLRKLLDVSKINNLGWFAKTKLEEGIKATIKCYEKELKNQSLRF